jgi:hypothetical protein
MGFWGGLFTGQNENLNKDMSSTGQTGDFASGLGQSSTGKGLKWFSDILSGDQSKISKALAPEFAAIQGQTQQQKNTTAQFGNRSGGNNAAMQRIGDKARAAQTDLVGRLQGGAASTLTSAGMGLMNTGLTADMENAELSQQQMSNWQNSLFGGALKGGMQIGLGMLGKWGGLKSGGTGSGGSSSDWIR